MSPEATNVLLILAGLVVGAPIGWVAGATVAKASMRAAAASEAQRIRETMNRARDNQLRALRERV